MIFQKMLEKRALTAPHITDMTYDGLQDWLFSVLHDNTGQMTAEKAIKNSNVYSCISILADDIAKLPIHTFANAGDKQAGMKHPVAKLLYERANQAMSAFTFKQTLQYHVGLYGNGYAYIEFNNQGYPVALWPLDAAVTRAEINVNTGALEYHTQDSQGKIYILKPHEVFHVKTLSRDGIVGIAPWRTLVDELSSQDATKKFISKFYENGTMSGGLLQADTKINSEAKKVLKQEWRRLFGGMENAHEVAILDNGLKYQPMGMQLDQAQFLETQKFGINEVAKVYRIPPHKLAQLDRATYANAEAMGLDYIKTTLMPIFTQWEQEIHYKLFTEQERAIFYVKFNAAAELRGDSQARAEYYLKMIQNGVYSVNEVREMEEMLHIGEAGDAHYISLNYTTLEAAQSIHNNDVKGGDGDGERTSYIDDDARDSGT